ncbi:MAG: hypothetical protein EAZ13_08615, partial [Sphingobacteriia bacterium]
YNGENGGGYDPNNPISFVPPSLLNPNNPNLPQNAGIGLTSEITPEEFRNWYLGIPEGRDGEYVNPDLIEYETPLIQQSLPSLSEWVNNFPKLSNSIEMKAPYVYQLIGGTILNSHINEPDKYTNACAIRGSRALLYSGVSIPVLKYGNPPVQITQKGGDNKNYILNATSFNKFMIDAFGDTPNKLEGADANDPLKVTPLLKGKSGIYVIANADGSDNGARYSGHVDAIIDGKCISGAYANPKGGVKSIRIWVLN